MTSRCNLCSDREASAESLPRAVWASWYVCVRDIVFLDDELRYIGEEESGVRDILYVVDLGR